MKTLRQRRWLLLLIPVLLLAAVLATLTLQGLVRQAIVLPLSYLLWLADLLLSSIPQSTFWALLLALGVYIAIGSLFGRQRRRSFTRPVSQEEADQPIPSRVQQRLHYLQQMNDSSFAREKISFELRRLIIDILAYQQRERAEEIERRVRSGALTVPPEVRQLLMSWQTWLDDAEEADGRPAPVLRWLRLPLLWRRFSRWLTRPRLVSSSSNGPSPYEHKVATVIDYMENQLSRQ